MFTGIIKKTARVAKVKETREGFLLEVINPAWRVKKGDSISINGVCSTVTAIGRTLSFEYMPETLARSANGLLTEGDMVNLEPSLRASDRLDGHIVLGHVDVVGVIKGIVNEGNSKVFAIEPREPKRFMKFIAEKGSVAVDGVSLTVVSVAAKSFTVKLIPYTLEHTAFKNRGINSQVNLELDILAKYLEKLNKSGK